MNDFIDALEGELVDAARRRAAAPRRRVHLSRPRLGPLLAGAGAAAVLAAGIAALDRGSDERAVPPVAPGGSCEPSPDLVATAPLLRRSDPADRPPHAATRWATDAGLGDAAQRHAVRVAGPERAPVWLLPSLPCDRGTGDGERLCLVIGRGEAGGCDDATRVRREGMSLWAPPAMVAGVGPERADGATLQRGSRSWKLALEDGAFAAELPGQEVPQVIWSYRGRVLSADGDAERAAAILRGAAQADLPLPATGPGPAVARSYVEHAPRAPIAAAARRAARTLGIADVRAGDTGPVDDVRIVLGDDWRP